MEYNLFQNTNAIFILKISNNLYSSDLLALSFGIYTFIKLDSGEIKFGILLSIACLGLLGISYMARKIDRLRNLVKQNNKDETTSDED